VLTRAGICVPATVTYLPYRVSGSILTAVGRSQLLARTVRWPGTHSRILSGIQRATQTVLGVYLKRTCSRVTSASSALGVLNDYALYKSTHSLTLPSRRTLACCRLNPTHPIHVQQSGYEIPEQYTKMASGSRFLLYKPKRVYRITEERVVNAVDDYGRRTCIKFLRSTVHNIRLLSN